MKNSSPPPTVGRHVTDSRPSVDRQIAKTMKKNCLPTVGRQSVEVSCSSQLPDIQCQLFLFLSFLFKKISYLSVWSAQWPPHPHPHSATFFKFKIFYYYYYGNTPVTIIPMDPSNPTGILNLPHLPPPPMGRFEYFLEPQSGRKYVWC